MSRAYVAAALFLGLAACGGDSGTSPSTTPPPPAVASVELSPSTASVMVGASVTLAAVTRDAQGHELTGRTISWNSSAPTVATVTSAGVVTGVAAGPVTISATSEGRSAQAQVTVTPVPIATVAITSNPGAVVVGRSATLAAVAKDAQGNVLVGRAITWSSASTDVATVTSGGVVTGVSLGSALITASAEGKSADASVTVVPVPVASVSIAPDTVSLKLSQTRAFVATVRDDLGNILTNRTVRWLTSNAAIARVDSASGMVLAEDDGLATITATVEGKSGSGQVRVYSPVASVVLSPALDTLEAWDVRQLQVTLRDAKNRILTGRQVTWTVNDVTVATLDQLGALTGIDRGTVTVTATSEGISGTTRRVVVIKYRSLSVGWMHACDIASGGITWCWGLNGREGRIGMASMVDNATSAVPVQVPGNHRFVQVSTFGRHSCAIERTGAAWCWGYNAHGELGSAGANSATPLQVGGGIAFRQVSAGAEHTCGLDLVGKAYCWGQNQVGQLGDGTNIVRSAPVAVNTAVTFASISTGTSTTCAVAASDGALFCWGQNALGGLGAGGSIGGYSTIPLRVVGGLSASQVSVGTQGSCAVTLGGQGYCWGGVTVTGAALQTTTPVAMAGGLVYRAMAQGASHGCGVTTGYDIYCWGNNQSGAAGIPGSANPMRPTAAVGGLKALEVSVGFGAHSCSVAPDRLTVHCWGQNDVGQLGNGAYTPQATSNGTASIVVGQKPLP